MPDWKNRRIIAAAAAALIVLVGLVVSWRVLIAQNAPQAPAPSLTAQVTVPALLYATPTLPLLPSQTAPTPTQVELTPTFTSSPTSPALAASSPSPELSFPIRAAFYYPWFPEAWNQQGFNPFTNYHPSAGFYDSGDPAILKKHIEAMQYGHIQAGIASWWGQGAHTDLRVPDLLKAAQGTGFRWALYYENESTGDPLVSQLQADLTYIRDQYSRDPSYLRVGGKFVVFVYAGDGDGCGMADRWSKANTVDAYIVLKVFPGYAACPTQPQGWHQYAPAAATDQQGTYSFTISPGFWKAGEPARLDRDLTRWNDDIQKMTASKADFQLITTFNEWGEGTAVEPAQEWASPSGYGLYLDALHNEGVPP